MVMNQGGAEGSNRLAVALREAGKRPLEEGDFEEVKQMIAEYDGDIRELREGLTSEELVVFDNLYGQLQSREVVLVDSDASKELWEDLVIGYGLDDKVKRYIENLMSGSEYFSPLTGYEALLVALEVASDKFDFSREK